MNLSCGGAGIDGSKKLPVQGLDLLLTIRPTREAVQLRARVAWVNTEAGRWGVEFLGTTREMEDTLRAFFPESTAAGDRY
jgi:hypothetical protein